MTRTAPTRNGTHSTFDRERNSPITRVLSDFPVLICPGRISSRPICTHDAPGEIKCQNFTSVPEEFPSCLEWGVIVLIVEYIMKNKMLKSD
jgi:hypothetical protein